MKRWKQLSALILLTLAACVQEASEFEPPTKTISAQPELLSDYLIFGTYYGMCFGDCAALVKIENGKAYADNVDFPFKLEDDKTRIYPGAPLGHIAFQETPLPEAYYDAAKTLLDNFPDDFARLKGQQFGSPDGDDRGGLYLETRLNGVRKIWAIDITEGAELPEVVLRFRQEIKDVSEAVSKISSEGQ